MTGHVTVAAEAASSPGSGQPHGSSVRVGASNGSERAIGSAVNAGTRLADGTAETLTLGGVVSSRATRAELAEQMVRDTRAARAGELAVPRVVISSNGMVIARYHADPGFRALVEAADIVDVDGMPLVFASKLLCRHPVRERVATTDFVRDAAEQAVREGVRFFFLGAQPGVAADAARNLKEAYPGLQIVGVRDGYFAPDEEEALCEQIRGSGADVLWLGLGSPYQERFALRNKARLAGLAWIRTCGGLFDFYALRVPRAPNWMQQTGFEWLYRTIQEPRRLAGRYFRTNPTALYHLLTKTHD